MCVKFCRIPRHRRLVPAPGLRRLHPSENKNGYVERGRTCYSRLQVLESTPPRCLLSLKMPSMTIADQPAFEGSGDDASLTGKAYKEIEEQIVTLRLQPGQVLSESTLAKYLSIG